MNATELTAPRSGWLPVFRDHARTHRMAAAALAVALVAALVLLAQGILGGGEGGASGLRYALLGGAEERFGTLYLIYADRAAGPGTLRLIELLRANVAAACAARAISTRRRPVRQ